MTSNKLISLSDAELDQVAGGLGFSFGVDAGRKLSIGAGVEVGHGNISVEAGVKVGPIKLGLGLGLGLFFGSRG